MDAQLPWRIATRRRRCWIAVHPIAVPFHFPVHPAFPLVVWLCRHRAIVLASGAIRTGITVHCPVSFGTWTIGLSGSIRCPILGSRSVRSIPSSAAGCCLSLCVEACYRKKQRPHQNWLFHNRSLSLFIGSQTLSLNALDKTRDNKWASGPIYTKNYTNSTKAMSVRHYWFTSRVITIFLHV